MVIYEVNLEVNQDIYQQYYEWLIEHTKELLKFKGFLNVEIGLVQHDEIDRKKKIRVNYVIDSAENLQNYLTQHSTAMRADAINKFGNQFSASRRIILDLVRFDAQ